MRTEDGRWGRKETAAIVNGEELKSTALSAQHEELPICTANQSRSRW